jgi:hypothetical protein
LRAFERDQERDLNHPRSVDLNGTNKTKQTNNLASYIDFALCFMWSPWVGDIPKMWGWTQLSPHPRPLIWECLHPMAKPYTYKHWFPSPPLCLSKLCSCKQASYTLLLYSDKHWDSQCSSTPITFKNYAYWRATNNAQSDNFLFFTQNMYSETSLEYTCLWNKQLILKIWCGK